jgi:hypothetical protein
VRAGATPESWFNDRWLLPMNWLNRAIHWNKTGNVYTPYAATVDDHDLELRLGDFPAEPLYTLMVDGVEVVSLESDWPPGWRRPTAQDEDSR